MSEKILAVETRPVSWIRGRKGSIYETEIYGDEKKKYDRLGIFASGYHTDLCDEFLPDDPGVYPLL